MKQNVLRRLGALALALAVALTLFTVPAWAAQGDLTLNTDTLDLKVGESAELTATLKNTVQPDQNGVTYKWESSDLAVTVTPSATDTKKAVVTPKAEVNNAQITVTASWTNADGSTDNATAQCTVQVAADPTPTQPPEDLTKIITLSFLREGYTWAQDSGNPFDITVTTDPAGYTGDISWYIRKLNEEDPDRIGINTNDTITDDNGNLIDVFTGAAKTIRVTSLGPAGEVELVATTTDAYGTKKTASQKITISGIVLNATELSMTVGESKQITVTDAYGYAASSFSISRVDWNSSDPSTVTVTGGELVAYKNGTAIITASYDVNRTTYTAQCTVTVTEDAAAMITGFTATTGNPLSLGTVYDKINEMSLRRTETLDVNGQVIEEGSPLNYITNVTVATSQGTMYYNYNSEANTGEGVGYSDCFAKAASGRNKPMDRLWFVPRQNFEGTADISFTGWAQNGQSFSGVIKVEVTGADSIYYKTTSGEPVSFTSGDFNADCRTHLGRDLNYVTFNLPQSGQGTLYYNYTGSSQYGDRVTTSTQYRRAGRYTIDGVSFVPNEAFVGTVEIGFRGVDTSGAPYNGKVVINVTPAGSAADNADVYLTAQRGQPVTLQPDRFNDACRGTIGDTLSYVRLSLPDYDEGTLYYNYRGAGSYDSRVDSSTRYFYSGTPGLGGVTFVPASNTVERVAIPYTGYGSGGTSFTGTLFITLGDENRVTVQYVVAKNATRTFDSGDFNNASVLQTGKSLDYVEFQLPDEIDEKFGTLYYAYLNDSDNRPVYSDFQYFRTAPNSYQSLISNISFHAGSQAGSITIPYTGYTAEDSSGERERFQGQLILQVGTPAPADVTLSGNTSGQVWLSAYALSSVCKPVMNKALSYIEITALPSESEGRLYTGYHGFKTGTQVKVGDRFYCLGAPNIDQLSFVPHGGFGGKAEITYIGYSTDSQEQVSGKIVVNVNKSSGSRFFNDMGNHVWAADAVDFLYLEGASIGVGGGRYNPNGRITKGDFTLMLVRAFGFKASGSMRFSDVPAGSYYAEAISIAAQLGIAGGSGGRYYPDIALSRQDAMVMIRNALLADGRTLTNGLAIDLTGYYDHSQIANYARSAVGTLVQMGVVKGDGNGLLRPRGYLNRAETAMLLHSIMTL